jgi:hypothetical protein
MKIGLLLTLALFFVSCERRTIAKLEGENIPRFMLSGSGRLGTVLVYAPERERLAESNPADDTHAIWEIEPEKEGEAGAAPVEAIKVITYGVVPAGYRQIKPRTGMPPALEPGKRYSYWIVTVNAPHAAGYFEIRNGKVVPISGP